MDRRFKLLRRTEDERDAHIARIRVKRLRYLLDPFKDTGVLVQQLHQLQTLLGELHDLHTLAAEPFPKAAALARTEIKPLEDLLRKEWLTPKKDRRLTHQARAMARHSKLKA